MCLSLPRALSSPPHGGGADVPEAGRPARLPDVHRDGRRRRRARRLPDRLRDPVQHPPATLPRGDLEQEPHLPRGAGRRVDGGAPRAGGRHGAGRAVRRRDRRRGGQVRAVRVAARPRGRALARRLPKPLRRPDRRAGRLRRPRGHGARAVLRGRGRSEWAARLPPRQADRPGPRGLSDRHLHQRRRHPRRDAGRCGAGRPHARGSPAARAGGPRPRRPRDRHGPGARLARYQAALRARRDPARRAHRRAARDLGPACGAGRHDPAARGGRARLNLARERGILRREPALLRGPTGGGRRDPGRLTGDYEALATKAMLDGFASIALSATLGWGVALAAITVLVYQGALSLGATLFEDILQGDALDPLTSAGGVLIIGISLKLLDLTDVKVGNFLPALLFAPALVGIVSPVD